MAELPASGKFVPRPFTVLDIGGQKMQGVQVDSIQVDSMFLQYLTAPDGPNHGGRTEGRKNFLLRNLAPVGLRA
jgi:hypothetical protein